MTIPYITRTDVIDHFLSKLPWPTPVELAPIAIRIKHQVHCPSNDGDEGACECDSVMSAVSEKLEGWRLSVALPRFGAQRVFEMPVVEGGHGRLSCPWLL